MNYSSLLASTNNIPTRHRSLSSSVIMLFRAVCPFVPGLAFPQLLSFLLVKNCTITRLHKMADVSHLFIDVSTLL